MKSKEKADSIAQCWSQLWFNKFNKNKSEYNACLAFYEFNRLLHHWPIKLLHIQYLLRQQVYHSLKPWSSLKRKNTNYLIHVICEMCFLTEPSLVRKWDWYKNSHQAKVSQRKTLVKHRSPFFGLDKSSNHTHHNEQEKVVHESDRTNTRRMYELNWIILSIVSDYFYTHLRCNTNILTHHYSLDRPIIRRKT